ncbi:ATP adenylyltransferase [Cupriavidus sp. TA19]|uniref:ATP adenylyltransferase family protein n=1 Tax=unclassified Cupriavidus TaxID=2640874 RepID=UPI0027294BB2|nr:phosphorylase [Cupriavidus sp. TA19]GLC96564.1 ATP adenylyltransferase [Cupriavidus sp. TA19]
MHHPHLQPGTLRPAIVHRTAHALQSGALCPIETIQTVIEDGGVRFRVRAVSSLRNKDKARKARNAGGNPFLPYDAQLFVSDISDDHVALLNKFNVIEHHLLIVTRCFEPQESLLTVPDFAALLACMAEFPSLGFYNGGAAAGASQAHKHLQLVPLPLAEGSPLLPIDSLLQSARISGAPGAIRAVPGLPFAHAFTPLDLVAAPLQELARTACERYRALLDSVGVRTLHVDGAWLQSAPYNLLVMPAGLLLVRRARECVEGISLNALAFAGSLFVRDAAQMQVVERLGPMNLLRRAAAGGERGGEGA